MRKWIVGLFTLLLAIGSASATVLVTEPFDYGTTLSTTKKLADVNDYDGGTGWSTNWYDIGGGIRLEQPGPITQEYPVGTSLTAIGSRINDGFGGISQRNMTTPVEMGVDDIYFSALVKWTTGATCSVDLRRSSDNITRYRAFEVDSLGNIKTGIVALSGDSVALVSGEEYLVVGKLEQNFGAAAEVASLSVFPVSSAGSFTTEPTTWDVVHDTEGSGIILDALRVTGGSGGTSVIDEIRIGTTYEDVVGTFEHPAVAFDDFDYTPNTLLTNYNGGSGWSEGWTSGTAGGGLRLDAIDKSLWFGQNPILSNDETGHLDGPSSQGNLRTWDTPVDGTWYFTALVRLSGTPKARFELGRSSDGLKRMTVGFNDYNSDGKADLYIDSTTTGYPTTPGGTYTNVVTDKTYLLVAKRTGSGVYASLIEGDGTTGSLVEPTVWQVEEAGTTGLAFDLLSMSVTDSGIRIDDVRIATSWEAAVFQVPTEAVADPLPPYEDFDYPASANLTTVTDNNGDGWADAWQTTGISGLTMSGSGKSLYFGQSPDLVVDGSTHAWSESSKGNERDFAMPVDIAPDTLYFTTLIRTYGGGYTNADLRAEFFDAVGATGNMRGNVGISDGHLFVSGNTSGYLQGDIASNAVAEATTYLLAMKRTSTAIYASLIEADGDSATLASEPTWQVTDAVATGVEFQSIRLLTSGDGGGAGIRIDELRINTSWDGAVSNLLAFIAFPELDGAANPAIGDLDGDGSVTQADVDLADSYLDGSVDGGASAETRVNDLIAQGYSENEAMELLNLTDLDINGDGTFDADDVTAVEALISSDPILIQISLDAGTLDFAWNSLASKVYDLESSASLTPTNWAGYGSYTNIAATAPTNTLNGVATDGAVRFFRVIEKD